MLEFIMEYWDKVLLSLLTTGSLGLCGWFWSQLKNYKVLLEDKKSAEGREALKEELNPIYDEIEELRAYIRDLDKEDTRKFNLIISSYRFRLVQLCRIYLRQGYMLPDQREQLIEFFNLYSSLGGNGAAKQYFDEAIKLPDKHK